MTDAAAAADTPAINLSNRQKLEILGAILLALFLFALDQTVVGTALPIIVTDLNGNELYTWAVTVYLLTSTISGPIYGKLSDLYGRRPIFLWALSLFLVASVLCGLAQEMWQFILFRGLQGLGGGAVFPVALAVVADLWSPAERGKYLGLFGAVFGLSSLLGPGIGGFITDTWGWHWIFFVNVPIALVSLIVCWRLLPPIRRPEGGQNIDYIGAAVFTAAIAPFLIGLSNKQNGEWTDPTVGGFMLVGLVFGLIFVFVESRAADPIVPLELFRNRSFTISVTAMFLVAFGFFAGIIFLPRYFIVVEGASATESGYSLLPMLLALIVSATLSGQIVARTHRYKLLIFVSMVLLAAGCFLMTNLTADTDRVVLWVWMVVAGLGIGPSFAVFTLIVQNAVVPRLIGTATSSLTFFQQIGGTVGLTIAGTLFADRFVAELPKQLESNGADPLIVQAFGSAGGAAGNAINRLTGTGDMGQQIIEGTPEPFRPLVQANIDAIVAGIHDAFSIATASVFYVGIVAAVVAAIFVLFLRELPMREGSELEAAADAPKAVAAPGG
ncbi:MAG TPA: MDR family MFS transporter [Candidatus Limnocylindrales bacterium]|nr:MDR family MFS transporter [Candidatus Limnocylindrales bacterium]